jgi:hypothetical protein
LGYLPRRIQHTDAPAANKQNPSLSALGYLSITMEEDSVRCKAVDDGRRVSMTELTEPILKALDERGEQPLQLVDPRSGVAYLLVRADLFERMEFKEDDSFDGIDVGALIAQVMREDDENDPFLESYQKYRGTDDPAR